MNYIIRPFALVLLLVLSCSSLEAAQASDQTDASSGKRISGPVAKDIEPGALWDGRGLVPFHALDSPKMVPAAQADYLAETDYVLGISLHGESRAYPARFIWWHHVINDRIGRADAGGESPIAVTYCSVCNTGIRYDLALKDHSRKLDFFGLYNGVVALCDRETGSVLLQVDGRFVTGPLLGETLQAGPLLDTTWAQWKQLHPDTLVMSPEAAYLKYYSPKDKPEPRGYDHFPAPFFQPTMTRSDKRLPFFEKVLAVTIPISPAPGQTNLLHRAYPIAALEKAGGAINDTLGQRPVVVFFDPDSRAAVAFLRDLEGKSLTFDRKQTGNSNMFVDKETRTLWDIEGGGQSGPLKGKSLVRLNSHLSQWYGWAAYFPDTSIYGREDTPQPVDLTPPDSKDNAATAAPRSNEAGSR